MGLEDEDPRRRPSIFEQTEPALGAIGDMAEVSEIYRLLLVNQRPRWWATQEQRRVYARDLNQWVSWCVQERVHRLSGRVLDPGEEEGDGLWDDELGEQEGVVGGGRGEDEDMEGMGEGQEDEDEENHVGSGRGGRRGGGRRHATRKSRGSANFGEGSWVRSAGVNECEDPEMLSALEERDYWFGAREIVHERREAEVREMQEEEGGDEDGDGNVDEGEKEEDAERIGAGLQDRIKLYRRREEIRDRRVIDTLRGAALPPWAKPGAEAGATGESGNGQATVNGCEDEPGAAQGATSATSCPDVLEIERPPMPQDRANILGLRSDRWPDVDDDDEDEEEKG